MIQKIINDGSTTIRHPSKDLLELRSNVGFLDMSINMTSTYESERGGEPILKSTQLKGRTDIKLYIPLQSAPESIIEDYRGLSVDVQVDGINTYNFPMCQLDSIDDDGNYVFIVQIPNGKDACYKNRSTMMTEKNSS